MASKKSKTIAPVAFISSNDSDDESSALDFSSLKNKGNDHATRGEFSKALTCFDGALRLLIDNSSDNVLRDKAILHELRAQVLMQLDEDFRAVLAAREATNFDPGWSEGWLTLARAQMNLGEPKLAVESYSKVLNIDPKCEEAIQELEDAQRIEAELQVASIDGRAAAAASRVSHS